MRARRHQAPVRLSARSSMSSTQPRTPILCFGEGWLAFTLARSCVCWRVCSCGSHHDRCWRNELSSPCGAVQKAGVEERAGSPGGCGRGRHGVAGHGGWRWTAVVGTGRTETRGAVRQARSGRVRMTMTPPGTSEQPRPTSTPGAGKTKVGIHGIAMDMDMDMASTAHGGTARAGSEQ